MHKLANKLSRKRVAAYADGDWPDNFHEGIKEMARVLLAVMDAKPVGSFHIVDQQVDGTTDYVADGSWPIDNGELLVYAHPPLPISAREEFVNREDYYQRCEVAPHREY